MYCSLMYSGYYFIILSVISKVWQSASSNTIISFYSDVDKVHDIMDDIAEQHDISREITDAISNNVAFPNDIDEDELEKELEELEQVCL